MEEKPLDEVRQSRCAGEETPPGGHAISWNRVRLELLAGAACPSKSDAVIFGAEEGPKPDLEDYTVNLLARHYQVSSPPSLVFTTQ